MGRNRVKMELIKNEKNRQTIFKKRKSSLFKKANELSILCEVKAGIIIYGPESDDEPEIWNKNPDDINELIEKYKNQPIDEKKKRTRDLSYFLEDRKNKSETALSKLRKKNNDAQYPTWDNLYNDLSEEQLRELVRVFDAKLEAVKARFDLLKGNYGAMVLDDQAVGNSQPLDQLDQNSHYHEFDYFDSNLNLMENDLMMSLMNNNSSVLADQFGEASYYAPPNGGAFYYDPMIGMTEESMAMNNAEPFMCYYGPTMPQDNGTAGPSSQMNDYYYYDQNTEFNY